MRLDELFTVVNGLATTGVVIKSAKEKGFDLAYIRPSSTWKNLVIGFVSRDQIPSDKIFPSDTLFVSTNGEGSHTYSYVSPFEFVPNSDVAALVPKRDMNLNEKLFYAACITKNRYKFSYGRKPKGDRLGKIDLPSKPPKWISKTKIENVEFDFSGSEDQQPMEAEIVPLNSIFHFAYGSKLDFNKMTKAKGDTKDTVNFVSRKSNNLGIVCKVKKIKTVSPFEEGKITVTLGGTYLLSSYVQPEPFYTAQNIAVLSPWKPMSFHEKLYYCLCIEKNRYLYSAFGREANRTLRTLPIPARPPKWLSRCSRKADKILSQLQESLEGGKKPIRPQKK